MLAKLSIQNYAIIHELEIDFSGKLNIITGETGAGKSIIVGALGLIMGERADSAVLVNKQRKCFVEGIFDGKDKKEIRDFLLKNDIDTGDELIIRREISSNGKSRAFINDSPVTLTQLNSLSSMLVDLHQQFDTLELGESDFQRQVLDALAGNGNLLNSFAGEFKKLQSVREELFLLKQQKLQFEKEYDYNKFQFDELDEAGFRENELEDLEGQLKMLTNAEAIRSALSKVYFDLKESETAIVQQLKVLYNQLQAYTSYHPDLPALLSRLQSTQIELQDIASDADHINNMISYDPATIEEMNERLSLGYKLLKKHAVQTTNDLLQLHKQLGEKLEAVLNIDEQIVEKEKFAEKLFAGSKQLAAKLSERRNQQSKKLETQVNKLLTQVGMPNARLKVEIKTDLTQLNSFGADKIDYLFDANQPGGEANKNNQFQSLRKVASGGELSRLMLCIKSLVAEKIDLPTLIFDEIDSGISGEAARQVGIIMKELSSARQLISITHQPQIAGKADAHFFVYKEIVNDEVKTNIRRLSTEERITTIAKMLSGEKPTAAALENAREMVMN